MTVEIPRDRWGKPLIIPPDGGKPVAYYRASSFGDVLDDKSNLEKYLRRMAVKGLTLRPDLHLAASTTPLTEKWRLDQVAEDAIAAAGGGVKASVGTSLHTLTELLDRGEPLPPYPREYEPLIAAYAARTEMFDHHFIEEFLVCDELGVAGTPDRISWQRIGLRFGGGLALPGGRLRITDLKTGGHADYLGKYAVQLAIYAHSFLYDPATGDRTPIQVPGLADVVDQDWGVIFHAPSDSNTCDLYALDLKAGWEGALLAADIRKWRRRKGLAVINSQEVAA